MLSAARAHLSSRRASRAMLAALLAGSGGAVLAADVTRPAPVTGLLLDRNAGDVHLQWSAVTADISGGPETVTSYNIYRGSTPIFIPDRIGHSNRIGTAASPSFTDTGAGGTTSYYYLVSAADAAGNESSTRPAKIATPPVLSGGWTETTVELGWTSAQPSGQVAGYRVYYGKAPGRYESADNVGLSTSHSLAGLQIDTFYWTAVTALDADGNESPFSNEHAEAVAGRGRIRAHDDDYLCWGAASCPPDPGEVQRSDGWQLLVPTDFPAGSFKKVTVTYTIDSRLCQNGSQGTTDKCGATNPGGYNTCGDPWDRIAHLFLVLDDCVQQETGCINPSNLELMRAITPFGTDAPPPDGSGVVPPRVLTLDVTPYAPLLTGRRWVGAEIGHFVQAGWHVTVDFAFSKRNEEASSDPPADGIVPLVFDGGGGITTPRPVTIPPSAQQVFARFFITGHGGNQACDGGANNGQSCAAGCPGGSCQNCDEFCHRDHFIKVDGATAWQVVPWRSDCSPGGITACAAWNACGWPSCTFSRAGWCPGYIACHKNPPCDQDIDFTQKLTPGTHNVTWEIPIANGSWSKSMVVYWYNTSHAICGNGIRESTEVCDGADLGGQSCQTQGFDAGTLACNASCSGFNTSNCRDFACSNLICERAAGEDCLSCPGDCNGVQGGNPGNRYCCGDGAGQNPVCSDPRCFTNGRSCE